MKNKELKFDPKVWTVIVMLMVFLTPVAATHVIVSGLHQPLWRTFSGSIDKRLSAIQMAATIEDARKASIDLMLAWKKVQRDYPSKKWEEKEIFFQHPAPSRVTIGQYLAELTRIHKELGVVYMALGMARKETVKAGLQRDFFRLRSDARYLPPVATQLAHLLMSAWVKPVTDFTYYGIVLIFLGIFALLIWGVDIKKIPQKTEEPNNSAENQDTEKDGKK